MKKENSLTPQQSAATDPTQNIWIQANAGTGKTKVLVQRLLRILFRNGTDKRTGILCLTYTNAGASEMRNRTLAALQDWAMASDEELQDLLVGITSDSHPGPQDLARARSIFFYYIDNPEVLKIKTIHAFCEEILRRFPTEAGLSPSWTLISDTDQRLLMFDAFSKLATQTNTDGANDAFGHIIEMFTERNMGSLLNLLYDRSRILLQVRNITKYRDYFIETTKKILVPDNDKSYEIPRSELENLLFLTKEYEKSRKTPAKYITTIITKTQQFIDNTINFEEYKTSYLTNTDTKNQNILKNAPDFLVTEQNRVYEKNQQIKNQQLFDDTLALFDLTVAFANIYNQVKQRQNVIDFDDMIAYTHRLFSNPETMGWILSQLDIGLGYILMDEAQDTNRLQWDNFNMLQEDFFTTGTDEKNPKTVFVVGDTKQSIYAFQGADPDAFQYSREQTGRRLKENMRDLHKIELEQNFRSTAPILSTIDNFFNDTEIQSQTHFDTICHKCFRQKDAGLVEIHKYMSSRQSKDSNILPTTQDEYVEIIVNKIRQVLCEHDANGKQYTPKDIMILVGRRGTLAPKIIDKLQQQNIQIAGRDRINLPNFLAIRDLMRLTRFVLNTADDYSLCCVLKSPICRLKEQDIFDICSIKNQMNAIRQSQNESPITVFEILQTEYPDIYAQLCEYIKYAETLAPYSFFYQVLSTHNVRHNMLAEFGPQLIEPLEEFMTLCLSYERTQSGTLRQFIKWFVLSNNTIKRDMDASDGVRVMTIHGSKGLQSPVVFLVDTTSLPEQDNILPVTTNSPDNLPVWIWRKSTAFSTDLIQPIIDISRTMRMDEYYRLLYVAMTRAGERLYIYGHGNHTDQNTWHSLLWKKFSDDATNDVITITNMVDK